MDDMRLSIRGGLQDYIDHLGSESPSMNVNYIDHLGSDLTIVNAARVSLDKWKDAFDEHDDRLIRYLARENHISPFFHASLQLRIEAPIFVARQWFRSAIGVARNEVSRRYVDDPPTFHLPDAWRSRPEASIKQGSGGPLDEVKQVKAAHTYMKALGSCERAYGDLLAMGVAPEQARMILPQSMMTKWIETGSLAYFARVCQLRQDTHAQVEIQRLAEQVGEVVGRVFPVAWSVLMGRRVDGTAQPEPVPG